MKNFVYLDNAAAMFIQPETVERFALYASEYFPNQEAEHAAGRDCAKEIKDASLRTASALTGSDRYSVFWTSSATEAINSVFSYQELLGDNVLTTQSEHPAIAESLKQYSRNPPVKIKINNDGMVDIDHLKSKLTSSVSALVMHHVQNETGAVQNLELIRKLLDKYAPEALLITDTVQAAGKIDIPWEAAEINIGFIGGHKIGVPGGGAVIYKMPDKGQNRSLERYLSDLRTKKHAVGRTDPPIALTVADIVEDNERLKKSRLDRISHLNSILRRKLLEMPFDVRFLISEHNSTPYILSIILPPYQGQVLVRMLSEEGVMVSEGSACEAASGKVGHALLAMNVPKHEAFSVMRISFGFMSDESDVNAFATTLQRAVQNY